MIFGIGIDIVDVKRIEAGLEKLGNRFLHRIFTEYEIQRKKNSASYHLELPARFAAKEAFATAIKGNMTLQQFSDIETAYAPVVSPVFLPSALACEVALRKQ